MHTRSHVPKPSEVTSHDQFLGSVCTANVCVIDTPHYLIDYSSKTDSIELLLDWFSISGTNCLITSKLSIQTDGRYMYNLAASLELSQPS